MPYKISVIVPFFNSEGTIGRCAGSLFAQTFDDVEYIFVDDGSTDSSSYVLADAINEYDHRKGDVIILTETENKGQSAARRRGVDAAHGEYIIHCDSDDYIAPDMYEKMYDTASNGSYDIVQCGYVIEQPDKESQVWSFEANLFDDREKLVSELLLDRGLSSLCDKLVSRKLYKKVTFPLGDIYEDFAVVAQLYLLADSIAYVDCPYYHYLRHDGSSLYPVTQEAYKKSRIDRIENVKFICDVIENSYPGGQFKRELEALKLGAKNYWLVDKESNYLKEWGKTFPEIFPSLLFNPIIPLRAKVGIILRLF